MPAGVAEPYACPPRAILPNPWLVTPSTSFSIQKNEVVEFIEKTGGRRIEVRRADVTEVFLVTLVGSGAWALIAANLARLERFSKRSSTR